MIDAENQNSHLQAERYFVENMIRLRESLGWSQTELARRMVDSGWPNYNQMTVSRTEKLERPLRLSEAEGIAALLESSLESMMMEPQLGALEDELWHAFNLVAESFGTATTALGRLVSARSSLNEILRADDMVAAISDNSRLMDLASAAAARLEDLTLERVLSIARHEPSPLRVHTEEAPHAAWERFQAENSNGAELS